VFQSNERGKTVPEGRRTTRSLVVGESARYIAESGQRANVPSGRALLAVAFGLALLAHPVVGNGPGPDERYAYSTERVDVANDEAVEVMYHHPAVAYGTGERVEAVHRAANETVRRSASAVSSDLRSLVDVQYLADDVGDQYYRLDAAVTDETYRLRATPVSAATVAAALAVDRDGAEPTIRAVLDDTATARERVNATLVDSDDGYRLVWPSESRRVPDPLAPVKVVGYGLGIALVVVTLVLELNERRGE
jgi:hypothetical protein